MTVDDFHSLPIVWHLPAPPAIVQHEQPAPFITSESYHTVITKIFVQTECQEGWEVNTGNYTAG